VAITVAKPETLLRIFGVFAHGTNPALQPAVTRITFEPSGLRERVLIRGPETLGDADLIAILLGTGTEAVPVRLLAAELLDHSGGLDGIQRLGGSGLSSRHGIGPAKAARIMAGLELGHRALLGRLAEAETRFASFEAVVRWARPRLAILDHEEVWLLSLDGRNGLRGARRIAQGGLHGCALTPRDVLRPAVHDAASAIVLIHNHPSGDPTPSIEDVEMTRAVATASRVIGIDLLDHVVVARDGARSLRDLGAWT
jgi:DNA repair protein RadC